MIASAQTIRRLQPVTPFIERTVINGKTFGLSAAGYDIRVAETLTIPPKGFVLASSIERFHMPNNLLGIVHDKSTWARIGLALQNTVIEPGWRGFLTVEISNNSDSPVEVKAGDPIAQTVFHLLDEPTEAPYEGKYQDQEAGAQMARMEPQGQTPTCPPRRAQPAHSRCPECLSDSRKHGNMRPCRDAWHTEAESAPMTSPVGPSEFEFEEPEICPLCGVYCKHSDLEQGIIQKAYRSGFNSANAAMPAVTREAVPPIAEEKK